LLGTNSFDGYSRDYLQAAYIAQKEYNDLQRLPGGVKVRLLIAKSGSDPVRSSYIARLVVKAAQADKTIVGVMGWTTSATSVDVVPILAQSHIPIVSAGVASDLLTNISPYFFRVGPPNKIMTKLLAQYVESKLHPQRLVIFKDTHEAYSLSLSEAFTNQMNADGQGNHIASTQEFLTGEKPAARLSQLVQNTLRNYHPDVIFMTSNSVEDMATLLNAIPSTAEFAQLKVVMGIAGYELTESNEKVYDYNRLIFSSAASPAIWDHLPHSRPIFFNDYPSTFDPLGTHKASPYTYDRPNSFVMLGYDAMLVLLKGSEMALQGGKKLFTPEELRQTIAQINGTQTLHGITGQIDLGRDGDPINKTNFVLHVDDSKHLQIDDVQGCFDDATICAKKAP
jgi:ABC-type branched-subunit amino acid transport system substrate-binding protein